MQFAAACLTHTQWVIDFLFKVMNRLEIKTFGLEHYKKYTPCLGINRGSSLFIGISYGADPKLQGRNFKSSKQGQSSIQQGHLSIQQG